MTICYNCSPITRASPHCNGLDMSRRSRAREVALQILYEDDLNPTRNMKASDEFLCRRLRPDDKLIEFARSLVRGVRQNRPQIDELLTARAENWSLGRMAVTDRNILRLAGYEILFGDTPGQVAINEAVELAKRYGGRQSPQFVNGVLDRLLKERNREQQ
jgi:transcription antitermination protein NusB